MDIKQVNSAIMFGNFTDAELSSVIDAVRFAKANLQKQVKRSLALGSSVRFHSTKRGVTMHGTVSKIAQKYVTVNTQQGLWKVPANMLEVA
jgi:hypothetical protein